MKYFHIQIQPERSPDYKRGKVDFFLEGIGITPEVSKGNDNGRYINFDFAVKEPKIFWDNLKAFILNDSSVCNSSIVCCEGDSGWDDYYLLHHFDKSLELDEIT